MSTTPDLSNAAWVKSTHSNGGGGGCVEWAPAYAPTGVIPVRDSKNPGGPTLLFTHDAWTAFTAAITGGELPTA